MAELFVALLHDPVLDRNARIVTAAITSLDIHDLARSAQTYEVSRVFIVHPAEEQRKFARTVIGHWVDGNGRRHDSRRIEALKRVEVVTDLDTAIEQITILSGARPLLVHTSARTEDGVGYGAIRDWLETSDGPPMLVLIGTGFGLADTIAARSDLRLAALRGPGDYNHLSVRAAASIIMDRLRGRQR